MISIVIRNKNEAKALENVLTILTKVYSADFDEIIVVDNNSTDDSRIIAEKFDCKIVPIDQFTYGKAINFGIEMAKNNYVLLLSSHAIPIGNSFFINARNEFKKNDTIAGLRFINSFDNYNRALKNDFIVKEGLNYGLMAACAMVNKKVWLIYKFDEMLLASEDKEWSARVIKNGYEIRDVNETFFYFLKRDRKSTLMRWKNEIIADYQLKNKIFPSISIISLSFLYRILLHHPGDFFKKIGYEVKLLKGKFEVKKILKELKNN